MESPYRALLDQLPQRRRDVSADGVRTAVFEYGPEDAPAIVFVHGLSCTALGWDEQFADAALRHSFHLVRYEMRGHGRSGKPLEEAGYESVKIAQDFRTVCSMWWRETRTW